MMDFPLLLKNVLYRAYTVFPEKQIVSRDYSGVFRYTYRELHERVCRLANALSGLGVGEQEHVASFAWNNHRHLELYFAVPLSHRVLHTVNIRLFREQLIYTIRHAEDRVLFVDEDLLPIVESISSEIPSVHTFVIMTDNPNLPETKLPHAVLYEDLLATGDSIYSFPDFAENDAAIIGYTSATTGDPKGVVYSHRGLFLHCLACMTGELGTREDDVTLPIVPMFHVNAWGRPYIDTWAGATQVYPGARPTPVVYSDLIQQERVTLSAGVPTIWMGILQHIRQHPGQYDLSHVRYLLSGGAALPMALSQAYEEELGVKLYQGYGQTETSPVTFINVPKAAMRNLEGAKRNKLRTKTGLLLPGLEMKLVGPGGQEVAHNGQAMGELLLRGPWIIDEYYKNPEKTREAFTEGWFRTGDIAVLDEDGYLQVVDRTKDLIKSGGEWISSVDLENALMAHPGVAEAAVIGVPDDKWQERPLACVVLRKESAEKVTPEELRDFLADKVAKWWIPEKFLFIDEVPKTSVGKFSKRTLRQQYESGEFKS